MRKVRSAAIIVVIVGVAAVFAVPTKMWVGSTDLEVEFVVTEGQSGLPVPNAIIEIHSEGGFYEEREPRDFKLTTDVDGVAKYICRDSMCAGSKGLFIDTFGVHLPHWTIQVVALGFEKTEKVEIEVLQRPREAKRTGVGKSKIIVPMTLGKRQ